MCRVIAISNQKGGVGKTTTTVNLGIGLARQGKKVLLIDADPQGSLTASLGYVEPDEIGTTLATIMMAIINEKEFEITDGILHHKENVDLLPANIELSALEVTMGNVMSRELIMKEYIEAVRTEYDYILIDCMPSLGLMTINALVAADSVLIPVQAAYLPVKGLQQLIHTIAMVKKRLNRKLIFEGILLTMVDFRTNYAKDVAGKVREAYGEKIEIFDTVIPMSVKAAETSAEGVVNFFVKEEKKQQFEEEFRKNFSDTFLLLTKEEVREKKLFGPGKERSDFERMMGDYLAVAGDDLSIYSHKKEEDFFIGVHAGLLEDEMVIPLILIGKDEL